MEDLVKCLMKHIVKLEEHNASLLEILVESFSENSTESVVEGLLKSWLESSVDSSDEQWTLEISTGSSFNQLERPDNT